MKGDVCNQTAAIFERTGSRSLVVAGATRYSVRGNHTLSCQPKNAIADAAHNNLTMFHTMCVGVYEASNNGIFMQWHGQQSCPQSGAFISAGAKGSHPIYKEKGAYVNKLVSTVNKLAGENIATTPLQDRKCPLVASTNVFGRIVNGVGEENVCKGKAGPKNVTGNFIHIEQQRKWRDDWANPLDKCN
uniref:Pectate lyase n=1 Tax=Meloidogyne incognita TaxID=6306 RepID=A0A914MEQ6_MELIC